MPTKTPLPYRLWFRYVEPLSALSGAYLAWFRPATYLQMTNAPSFDETSTVSELAAFALQQLASVFVFFGLAESLVLHVSNDLKVHRALVFSMIGSDLVWMSCMRGLGGDEWYWVQPWLWDSVGWGNFGVAWTGFILRVLFLAGVGF
ncbi:hypothetical protein AJ79_06885 [Helicocarpus griseus UAMH5409]|uniref:DUF7704 domain-containing protein n=1 Tax=Helicocarpus griseus UAMH5409 TaxID=1447875 RepID=A0A2B7X8U5_9EURO|nr:hypothetical protein AJ79_06885 [Helicocarpus griseus UAMH5409]